MSLYIQDKTTIDSLSNNLIGLTKSIDSLSNNVLALIKAIDIMSTKLNTITLNEEIRMKKNIENGGVIRSHNGASKKGDKKGDKKADKKE
jgi:hypothetical protein